MKLTKLIALPFAITMVASVARAQDFGFGFDTPTPTPAAAPANPWDGLKLSPTTKINLDFRNASIDAILHTFSQASGVAIIKDPGLSGGVTLQSPKPQTLTDAFSLLNAVLGLKNYAITRSGNFLMIKPSTPSFGGRGGFGAGATGGYGGRGNRNGGLTTGPTLKVYPLKYASASDLAKVINDVFANATDDQTATIIAALQGNGASLPAVTTPTTGATGGFGGNGGGYGGRRNRGGGGGGTTQGATGGFDPTALAALTGGAGGANGRQQSVVKASADDYSNSLIVNAPSRYQDQIAQIISQVDRQTDVPQQSKVFKLEYANATDLQPVIQSVLSGTATLGRGSAAQNSTNQSRNNNGGGGGGFFQRIFGGGGNSSSNTGGSATADTRTNSLVVTSTTTNLDHVTEVIAELDKPATYQSTTWVYVLKNARADVIANLLNQSFGNRTTNGPVGGSLSGSTSVASSTSSSGAPASLSSATSNNNRSNNNAPTYSSNTQNQTASTTGLDSDGHVVNIRNLTGVLLVPNIDTNSIIVVAPPEDKTILTGILDEMDAIPEQVMIETLVVEANLDKSNSLGVEFNFKGNPFGTPASGVGSSSFGLQANTAQPQGFRYTLTAAQYSVFLQAVQTDTKFNVLSTPRIFTTNNAPAQINISQSLPYVTNQTVDTTGTILYNYNFLDVGIVLTVTPRITSNGYVTMDVSQTANDFVGYTSFNAPIVNQREAQTTVSVKDGETIVLGGIINNTVSSTENKIPLLGDIPGLGNLFRSSTKTKNKTELLVFLTPRVVRDPDEARRLREQTERDLGRTTQEMLPTASTASPLPKPAASVDATPLSTTTGTLASAPMAPAASTTAVPATGLPSVAAPNVSVTYPSATPPATPPSPDTPTPSVLPSSTPPVPQPAPPAAAAAPFTASPAPGATVVPSPAP